MQDFLNRAREDGPLALSVMLGLVAAAMLLLQLYVALGRSALFWTGLAMIAYDCTVHGLFALKTSNWWGDKVGAIAPRFTSWRVRDTFWSLYFAIAIALIIAGR